jgi:DNA repair exonuclease SbcCD ATPase subunit
VATAKHRNSISAQKLLQSIAVATQEVVHKQLVAVVTKCLKAVFGEDAYGFKIRFEQKRGKTEAVFVFTADGEEYTDLTEEKAGGQIEVAAFGLRLACLMMLRPKKRRLLILDEPFKNVNGSEYQERVAGLLVQLAEEMDVQLIVVSDDDWLHVGNVIKV